MGHTESLLFPVVLPFTQPTQMATAPDHIHPSALFNDISVPLSLYKELDKRTLKIIHWGTRFWRKRHGATILRTGQKRPGVLTRIKLIKTKNLCNMLIAYLYARVILLILLRHLEVSLNERTKTPDTAKNFMFSLILPSLFLSKISFFLNFLSYFFLLIWLNRISVYFCGVLAHSFFFSLLWSLQSDTSN